MIKNDDRAVHRNLRLVEAKLPVDKSRVGKLLLLIGKSGILSTDSFASVKHTIPVDNHFFRS